MCGDSPDRTVQIAAAASRDGATYAITPALLMDTCWGAAALSATIKNAAKIMVVDHHRDRLELAAKIGAMAPSTRPAAMRPNIAWRSWRLTFS